MKRESFPENKTKRLVPFILLAVLLFSLTAFSQTNQTQQPAQLSLADILIGLRSKKVTLDERNKILADAVKVRGITFALTPEIEKELLTTGADRELVEAIRQKSPVIKPTSTPVVKVQPTATPVPTPSALDYQKRANLNITKGEFDSAIADYNKVIEMKAADTTTYLNRGLAYYNKKNYELAIADYDKVIELNPKDLMAYLNRAEAYEKSGNVEKAISDYQKAVELDASNEAARNSLKRLQDEQQAKAKANEQNQQTQATTNQNNTETASTTQKSNSSEPVNVAALNNLALNLVTPLYPAIAKKSNIQGKVTVQVTLDEEGKVIEAKAIDGPSMLRSVSEDAVRKSKFKPVRVNNQAVKATGFIIYNFKTT